MSQTVYAIRLKGDGESRYIGLTTIPVACRLGNHLSGSPLSDFHAWLRSNADDVEAVVLGRCEGRANGLALEKAKIKEALALGYRLFNRHHVPGAHVRLPRVKAAA